MLERWNVQNRMVGTELPYTNPKKKKKGQRRPSPNQRENQSLKPRLQGKILLLQPSLIHLHPPLHITLAAKSHPLPFSRMNLCLPLLVLVLVPLRRRSCSALSIPIICQVITNQ
jgi:hypothetical protein